MQTPPDLPALAAFFRLMRARLGVEGLGIFALRPDEFRPLAHRLYAGVGAALPADFDADDIAMAPPRAWTPSCPALVAALGAGAPAPVEAARVGLDPGPALLVGVPSRYQPRHFLVAHGRPSRLPEPELHAAFADGAALLRPLLTRGDAPYATRLQSARPPGLAEVNSELRAGIRSETRNSAARAEDSAILPRATAHAMVRSLIEAAPTGQRIALLMIDLDRFRSINDALGMAAGDALLAVTGARLDRGLGPRDRLLRLEGDRFLVIAPGAREIEVFARHLLDLISRPLRLAGHTLTVQASIGLVESRPTRPTDVQGLLLHADSAMRRAKSEGRDRCARHDPGLDAANLEKSQLELDLGNAPANGQLHLSYQPFVDLATGALAGVEALMRWRHPARGDVPPRTFIPLAETTGLILPLGRWALRRACRAAALWPAPLILAVNISALQFHQPGFVAEVDAVLAETGFPAERLELEITETVLMRDNPETLGQLRALIARGIRVALDDFGTGYSALAYLARLPHHRIKLDHSFVQDLDNPATAELIRAIIAQARANGVAITAEGVERPEQLARVRAMGFTHAQGYATGTPTTDPAALFAERVALS